MAASISSMALVDDAVHAHIHLVALGHRPWRAGSGRTLKPTMMALEVVASMTSLSLIAPTPPWMTLTRTSSLESFSSDLLHRLHRALDVGLDDDVQILHLRPPESEQNRSSRLTFCSQRRIQGVLLLLLPLFRQLTGHAFICHGVEVVACVGHFRHAGDLHRHGGAGGLELLAAVVSHGTDTANGGAGNDDVALVAACRSAPAGWPRGRGPYPGVLR